MPPLFKRGLLPLILFFSFKGVFAEAADGAYPILGYILPRSTGSDAVFLIADFGVIFITAGANIFHYDNLHSAAVYDLKRSTSFCISSISHNILNINTGKNFQSAFLQEQQLSKSLLILSLFSPPSTMKPSLSHKLSVSSPL